METGLEIEKQSDEAVLALVPDDRECFGVLIRRYEGKLTGYIRRIFGGSAESVEDIVQNIFIKAYVHIHSFQKGQNFSSWLFGIAHNECIDYWRRNRKYADTFSLEDQAEVMLRLKSEDSLLDQAGQQELAGKMRSALRELPFKYREILVLRFLEDKSYEEIAEIIGKPVSTVGTLVRRGKMLLKEIIQRKKI